MVEENNTKSVPRQSLSCSFAPVTPVVSVAQPQQGGVASENAVRGWFRESRVGIMPLLHEVWIVSWLCSIRTPELRIPSPFSCDRISSFYFPLSGEMVPGKERLIQSPLCCTDGSSSVCSLWAVLTCTLNQNYLRGKNFLKELKHFSLLSPAAC